MKSTTAFIALFIAVFVLVGVVQRLDTQLAQTQMVLNAYTAQRRDASTITIDLSTWAAAMRKLEVRTEELRAIATIYANECGHLGRKALPHPVPEAEWAPIVIFDEPASWKALTAGDGL